MRVDMLTCQELTELVTDYLEGRLNGEERLRFDKHVGLCRHCRSYLSQMRTTVDLLGEVPDEPVPDHVMEELQGRFAEWKK
jgi:predicted anti-sigma-YlaC factor YlaD